MQQQLHCTGAVGHAPLTMRRVHGSRPLTAFHKRLVREERPLATRAVTIACVAANYSVD